MDEDEIAPGLTNIFCLFLHYCFMTLCTNRRDKSKFLILKP
jgi:hypothetical protein